MRGVFADLRDRVFGRLVVVDMHDKLPTGQVLWLCLCECGETKAVQSGHLTSGRISSCGCLKRESQPAHLWTAENIAKSSAARLTKRAARFEQARRRVWGLLTPVESIDRQGEEFWRCACVCGGERTAWAADIRRGKTISCGCSRRGLSYGKAHDGVATCA
jgi:hypothetical protein